MAADATQSSPPHLLLFDGECGLCNRAVQFVLRHDGGGHFHFARLQGTTGRRIVERAGGHPDQLTTLYVVPGYAQPRGQMLSKSDAVLFVLRQLSGGWRALAWAGVLPKAFRNRLYDVVARHRQRAGVPLCILPSPATRHRFIDEEA